MIENISIDSENLLEFCRLFTNQKVLFMFEVLLQIQDDLEVYIPKLVLQEITQIKETSFRRFIGKIENLGLPLTKEFVKKKVKEKNNVIVSPLELLDPIKSEEGDVIKSYELFHLPSFSVSIEFGHHEFAVDKTVNLPYLNLGTLDIDDDELQKYLRFLSKSKYSKFIQFLHSLYSSGLYDFDKKVITKEIPITTKDLNILRVNIQNKPLLGSGSLNLSELAQTKLFQVNYQTGEKSQFRLQYGGIKFRITPTQFQTNKYKAEIIDDKLIIEGQL